MQGFLPNLVKRIWEIEADKYKRKGPVNILIGSVLLYLYFWQLPILVQPYWPQNIEHKMLIQAAVTTALLLVSVFVFGLLYLPGYLGVKAYKKYEISPNLSKPWERDNWVSVRNGTIKNLCVIYFVMNPLYFGMGACLGTMEFQGFPTSIEIIKTFVIALVVDDFLYMLIHRALHEIPALYKYHKIHHEYDSVYSAMNLYVHPIEHILGNLLPGTILFGFMRVHIFTFILWEIFKLSNSADAHSGYAFPWFPSRLLPFNYDASYHEFHHSKNVGNYATAFYLFELILGYNKTFFEFKLGKQKQAVKAE